MRDAPLAGFTIGVTADRRAEEQIRMLASRGADCVHGPVIKHRALDDIDELHVATDALLDDPPDVVVLTTDIGVRSWLEAADAAQTGERLLRVLEQADLYARGPKAVGALAAVGLEAIWTSPSARFVDIVDELSTVGVADRRVAVQLDGAGATWLCDQIEAMGADLVRVPVYRWTLPDDHGPAERLLQEIANGRIDAVTFTTRPAVENFFEIARSSGIEAEVVEAMQHRTEVHCVGPVCATGFGDRDIALHVPSRHRLGALVQTVAKSFDGRSREFRLGGVPVRLQGRFVAVGSADAVALTDRERALLVVLLEQPGTVLSKSELLERLWHDGHDDTHVVEVTMARLRRRLGPAAAGIETVVRRGYRAAAE